MQRGPVLDFILCFVCVSRPRRAAAFLLCLFILLSKSLNVRLFPPPSSHIYELCYSDLFKCPVIDPWPQASILFLAIKKLEAVGKVNGCMCKGETTSEVTSCLMKLSRVEPCHYLDGRPPEKTRLLSEEVLVRPAGGAHPADCEGPNAPV